MRWHIITEAEQRRKALLDVSRSSLFGLGIDVTGIAVGGSMEEGGAHLGWAPPEGGSYFGVVLLVLTWPAMSLRSFGYSTISIRRLDDLPSSESFEARGCVSA